MTIQEVKDKKAELEKNIADMLMAFESETRVSITDVGLEKRQKVGGAGSIFVHLSISI